MAAIPAPIIPPVVCAAAKASSSLSPLALAWSYVCCAWSPYHMALSAPSPVKPATAAGAPNPPVNAVTPAPTPPASAILGAISAIWGKNLCGFHSESLADSFDCVKLGNRVALFCPNCSKLWPILFCMSLSNGFTRCNTLPAISGSPETIPRPNPFNVSPIIPRSFCCAA